MVTFRCEAANVVIVPAVGRVRHIEDLISKLLDMLLQVFGLRLEAGILQNEVIRESLVSKEREKEMRIFHVSCYRAYMLAMCSSGCEACGSNSRDGGSNQKRRLKRFAVQGQD